MLYVVVNDCVGEFCVVENKCAGEFCVVENDCAGEFCAVENDCVGEYLYVVENDCIGDISDNTEERCTITNQRCTDVDKSNCKRFCDWRVVFVTNIGECECVIRPDVNLCGLRNFKIQDNIKR